MPELRPYRRVVALIRFDARDGVTAEKALLLARLNRAELDFLHLIAPGGNLDGGYPGASPSATGVSWRRRRCGGWISWRAGWARGKRRATPSTARSDRGSSATPGNGSRAWS